MSGVATAVVASAVIGSQASKSAAKTQASASQAATDSQSAMFERQIELQKPYREAGEEALNRLRTGTKVGGEFDKAFSETSWTADPGYAFRMSEGMKALDRSAAARGGLISGAALRGATRYGQEMGTQEYQNAFNRYYTERANRLQPLQSIAGVGQTSANTLTNAAGQFGQQIGSNIIGAGNAMAAGQIGQANAISQGVGQGINFYQNQQMMNRLFPTASPNSTASGWQQSPTGLYTID
jgi:hypothetical protein